MGIIEGFTEFLPVSSTFHLIATARFLGVEQTDFVKLFEVFIQLGAILSVLVYNAKDTLTHRSLAWKLMISFVPTAFVGFFLYSHIKAVFEAEAVLIVVFGVVGLFFLVYEWWLYKPLQKGYLMHDISNKHALLVGLSQVCAMIPGVSRAGAVMIGMMSLGYTRSDAAKYSFLLAVPTMVAATGYDLLKTSSLIMITAQEIVILAVGFVTSFVVALFAMRWFVAYLQEHDLQPFGWYRIFSAFIIYTLLFM